MYLASEAVQGPSSLPCRGQVRHDHFQPLPLLDSLIEVLSINVLSEGPLDLGDLLIHEYHVLLLSCGLLLKFSLDLGLPFKVLTEVPLDLLGTVGLLQKIDLCLLGGLAQFHLVPLMSLDRGVFGGNLAVFTIMLCDGRRRLGLEPTSRKLRIAGLQDFWLNRRVLLALHRRRPFLRG